MAPLKLTAAQQEALASLLHDATTPPRLRQRARIISTAAEESPAAIARAVGLSVATVRVWIMRFEQLGIAGLADLAPDGAGARRAMALIAAPPVEAADRSSPWSCAGPRPSAAICRRRAAHSARRIRRRRRLSSASAAEGAHKG